MSVVSTGGGLLSELCPGGSMMSRWTSRAVSAVSTGRGLSGELCPGGSMMSGRQDGLAEQCPQSVQVGVY